MNAQLASGAPRLLSPVRATAIFVAVSATVGSVQAQTLQPSMARHSGDGTIATAVAAEAADTSEVALLVGRSTLLSVGAAITRVSLTSPNVADAMVTSPGQLLIHGKAPGTISMFVWDRAGGIKRYEVIVRRDLSELLQQVKALFPGEPIDVHSNGKDVVISGTVSSKYVIDKAAEVAAGYVEKKEDVVNLLRQQEGIASNQVMLRVRFAEVSRSAMQELGVNFFATGVDNGRWFGRTTTGQSAAPTFDDGKLVFSDFLNLFLFDAKNNIGGAIKALQNKGLFQSLAEPNLIAENGKEASFLAGGEYPYPVVQGQSGGIAVTIQFKEFGVRLTFTPTIVGNDLVKLKVAPEVSSLDFSQRDHARRLPGAGDLDAPHANGSRTAGRADVRDRRADEQHHHLADVEDSRHRRHPDPRLPVPQQGGAEEPDGARRDDHAADPPPRLDGRLAEAAGPGRALHAAGHQDAAVAGAVESRRAFAGGRDAAAPQAPQAQPVAQPAPVSAPAVAHVAQPAAAVGQALEGAEAGGRASDEGRAAAA